MASPSSASASSSSSSSSSALPSWLARWSPFAPRLTMLDIVVASETCAVEDPVHANQRVHKSFTVVAPEEASTKGAIHPEMLVVHAPGLTVVRVRPQLLDEVGPDVLARVRVSSDAEPHLERVNVEFSGKNTLFLNYNTAKPGTIGHLVTEVDVARASQIKQVIVMGGGDVVLQDGVLGDTRASVGNESNTSKDSLTTSGSAPLAGMLVSIFGSRLFVAAPQSELRHDNLYLAALGSSSIHMETKNLGVSKDFIAAVVGSGSVAVHAETVDMREAVLAAMDAGNVHLGATSVFRAGGILASLKGDGLIRVTTPPDALVETSLSQEVRLGRGGTVDLADVPSVETKISFPRPFKGLARVRAPADKLTIKHCGSASRVQYVGELPTDISQDNSSVLLTQLSDADLASVRAAWDDRENTWQGAAAVPTIESAFETPVALDGPSEGWFLPIMGPLVRNILPF